MENINKTLAQSIYEKFKQEQKKKDGEPEWFLCEPKSVNSTADVILSKKDVQYHYNNTVRMAHKFTNQNEWAFKTMEVLEHMRFHNLRPDNRDLHTAVQMGFPNIIDKILQFDNININSRIGYNGRTPLHQCLCTVNINIKILCKLIASGAKFDVPDNAGDTCLNLVILFFNEVGQEWLPLLIMDHIVDYDYERVNNNGQNILDYAKRMNSQPSVIKKIETMSLGTQL